MDNVIPFNKSMRKMLEEKYTEFFIEYDNKEGLVTISGLCRDGRNDFWEEVAVESDIAEVESYAWGVHDTLKKLGIFSTVVESLY